MPDDVIVYEVNLSVERAIADEYRAWLDEHIAQMLALPGFVSAECFAVDADDGAQRQLCVQYRLTDQAALDSYLSQHAPRMRADAVSRFGGRFSATRRVLRPLVNA